MMDDDRYPADWRVTFPCLCDLAAAVGVVSAFLMCKWAWELFIWDLPLLHRLLIEQPASYDYLYVTRFLKARAAYLVLHGPFATSPLRVLEGIANRKIQFACIYRHVFLFALEQALRERERSPRLAAAEDRLFQVNAGMSESAYLQIVEVASRSPDLDKVVHGFPVSAWISGVLRPKNQPPVLLVPAAVNVPVEFEDAGWYRKVKPVEPVLMDKLIVKDRIRCFREHQGNGTPCDVELERLCNRPHIPGFPRVCCGEDSFQCFRTTANSGRNTLYVVCADRTLRIRQSGVSPPGSIPCRIYVPGSDRGAGSEYLVEFDNGALDTFALSFRAHYENERRDYLASLNGASCAWVPPERLTSPEPLPLMDVEAASDSLNLHPDDGMAPDHAGKGTASRTPRPPASHGRARRDAEHSRVHGGYVMRVRGRKSIQLNRAAYVIPTWRCCVEDRSFDFPEVVGSALLVRLLKAPGQSFYADGLLRMLTGEAAEAGKADALDWLYGGEDVTGETAASGSVRWQVSDRQEVWDGETIQREVNRIRTLRQEIVDCGTDPGGAVERGALEEELETRLNALQANSRPGPRGFPVPITFNGDLKKAANLVGKHFRGLLSRLKPVDEAIWRHFSDREILQFGQTCRYDKDKGYGWRID